MSDETKNDATPTTTETPLSDREAKLLRSAIWALQYCKLSAGQMVWIDDGTGRPRGLGFEQYMIEALTPYGITVDLPELLKQKYGKKKGR